MKTKTTLILLTVVFGMAAAPGVWAQGVLTINTETPTTFSATISGILTTNAGGNQPQWLAIKPNFPASEGVNVPWFTSFTSVVTNTVAINGTIEAVNTAPGGSWSYGDSIYWSAGSALTAGTIISGTITITGTFDYSHITQFDLVDGFNNSEGSHGDWNALAAISPVPEPSTLALAGLGGLLFFRRRK